MGICDRCGLNRDVYECFVDGVIEMLCEECSFEVEEYEDDRGYPAMDEWELL